MPLERRNVQACAWFWRKNTFPLFVALLWLSAGPEERETKYTPARLSVFVVTSEDHAVY